MLLWEKELAAKIAEPELIKRLKLNLWKDQLNCNHKLCDTHLWWYSVNAHLWWCSVNTHFWWCSVNTHLWYWSVKSTFWYIGLPAVTLIDPSPFRPLDSFELVWFVISTHHPEDQCVVLISAHCSVDQSFFFYVHISQWLNDFHFLCLDSLINILLQTGS